MTTTLPRDVSALIDPADEPYLRLLEHCARARRDLGLPSFTRAELEALLDRGHPTGPERHSLSAASTASAVMRTPSPRFLQTQELHPAIERFAGVGGVRRDRFGQAESFGDQSRARDVVAGDEVVDDGLCATLRQPEVVARAAV